MRWLFSQQFLIKGKPIDKGLIHKLLHNRTYLGELRHKEQWYPAEHLPIIDPNLWDDVQAILSTNYRVRGGLSRTRFDFLLKGIVFGNDGRALSPGHTSKKGGRCYRYYILQRDVKEYAGASGLPRMPAAELESAVLEQLRGLLRSPELLAEVLPHAISLDPSLDEAKATVALTRLDEIWDQLFPVESIAKRLQNERSTHPYNSYVSRMTNLTVLAPDIVEAILDDTLPDHVTLFDIAVDPPTLWGNQRALIGLWPPHLKLDLTHPA